MHRRELPTGPSCLVGELSDEFAPGLVEDAPVQRALRADLLPRFLCRALRRPRHVWHLQRRRKRVEEVFGWIKTVDGGRKLRYVGAAANRFWLEINASAYNLVRIARIEVAAA